jgi:hypothetical protein
VLQRQMQDVMHKQRSLQQTLPELLCHAAGWHLVMLLHLLRRRQLPAEPVRKIAS